MASVSYNQMLNVVLDAYPGSKWHERVSKMRSDQVIAIYNSIIERRAFEEARAKEEKRKPKAVLERPVEEFTQMDMFEYAAKEGIDIHGKRKT